MLKSHCEWHVSLGWKRTILLTVKVNILWSPRTVTGSATVHVWSFSRCSLDLQGRGKLGDK